MPTETLHNRKVHRINDHQQRTDGWQSRTIDKQELQKGRKAAHYYNQLTLNFHLRRKAVPFASICINPTPSVFARIRSTRNFQLFAFFCCTTLARKNSHTVCRLEKLSQALRRMYNVGLSQPLQSDEMHFY